MSKLVLYAKLPLPNGGTTKVKDDEPFKSIDRSVTKQVDRGYRAFWRRRGKKPPPVSGHYIERPGTFQN